MNILVIVAHPDDEILGCGGTIANYTRLGNSVNVIFLTSGITSRFPVGDSRAISKLAEIKKHAILANKLLGVSEEKLHFFEFEDQGLDTVPISKIIDQIRNLIIDMDVQLVFTHHWGDYNKDHRIAYEATLYATRCSPMETSPRELLTFEVLSSTERSFGSFGPFIPNTYIDISQTIDLKISAMSEYKSELRDFPHPRSLIGIRNLASVRGSEVGLAEVEAFHLVRAIRSYPHSEN